MLDETLPGSAAHPQLAQLVWYGLLLCLFAGLAWSVYRYRRHPSDRLLSVAIGLAISSVLLFFAPTYNLRSVVNPSWLHNYFSHIDTDSGVKTVWYVSLVTLCVGSVLAWRWHLKRRSEFSYQLPAMLSLAFLDMLASPFYDLRVVGDEPWLHQYFSQVNVPLTMPQTLWCACVLGLLVVAVFSFRSCIKQPDQSPIKVPLTIVCLLFLALALPMVVSIGTESSAWCRSIECVRGV
jgi:hypothetical protein